METQNPALDLVLQSALLWSAMVKKADMQLSVSHTTRSPRPGETNGVQYHFTDVPTFKQLIAQDQFIEWAEVFGNDEWAEEIFMAWHYAVYINKVIVEGKAERAELEERCRRADPPTAATRRFWSPPAASGG